MFETTKFMRILLKNKRTDLRTFFAAILFVSGLDCSAQLFPNGDFELGPAPSNCQCPTNMTCGNDAGRVIDGFHPVYAPGNQGCIGTQNYAPALGAFSGTSSVYFYAGADNVNSQAVNFVGGEEVCLEVWYCGPQGSGASGQNTANSHFSFGIDGSVVGPDVTVPVNTPWTLHSFTVIMTAGAHTFNILSGGAAQYAIWFDDFDADLCNVTACDPSWTTTSACSTDPPINLDALITGDTGGTWTGTGVTGNMFDPTSGTQSITYTNAAPCTDFLTQTITINTTADATWTIPPTTCSNAPDINLDALITGTTGGTWSGTGVTGNLFDPSSGTQNVTYTVGTVPCDDAVTQSITITPSLDPSWVSPGNICETAGSINLDGLITGDTGGTWSGNGVTGSTFDPTGLSGNISITYTIGAAPCIGTDVQDIIVNPDVDPTWVAPTTLCTTSPLFDLNTSLSGTSGGTWSGTGVTGNEFDPSVGTQTVTYSVGTAPCDEQLALSITVGNGPDPSWTTTTICASDGPIDLNSLLTINVTGAIISCFGLTDGTADVTVTGGSGNYTYSWNTVPVQTTSTASNLGTGLYTVTVTDVDGGCTVLDSIIITEPSELTAILTSVNGCLPNLGAATVNTSGGIGPYSYVWNNSSSTIETANDLDSAMHTVVITDASGCTYTDSVLVQLYPAPIATVNADTTVVYGNPLLLNGGGGSSYLWTPDYNLDCDTCQFPYVNPQETTTYCVRVTDNNGCIDSACVLVTVEIICGEVFVPSAFSPNGDGENELECVYSDCLESFTFTIYNRWGEKVFETSNENVCWDGTWNEKEKTQKHNHRYYNVLHFDRICSNPEQL
jgi:gliding motility-associated-like protein